MAAFSIELDVLNALYETYTVQEQMMEYKALYIKFKDQPSKLRSSASEIKLAIFHV